MSAVGEIKARLLQAPTLFTAVLGATSLAQIKDNGKPEAAAPVAFVLTSKEASAENTRATGSVLQRAERDIMVAIYAEHLGDRLGGDVDDDLEALKAFVRGRLIGWQTTDMDEAITHVGGEVVEARGGGVWFEDTFSAPTYIEEAS
jgi:hypothetical protein